MKVDLFRVIEFTVVAIFGFVGFLKTVYDWSNRDAQTTIISAVLFWMFIAIIGIIYVIWEQRGEQDA